MTPTQEQIEAMVERLRAVGPAVCDEAADMLEQLAAEPAGVRAKPLEWDFDGRKLRMDDTMAFSKAYDWDGYECCRQEGYGLGCGYIIWPDNIGGARWNLYGTADGLFVTDIAGEEAAKAAAQADYEVRVLAALEPAPDYLDGWNDAREAAARVAEEAFTEREDIGVFVYGSDVANAIRAITPPERPKP